jgi:hypothetical protein
MPHSTTKQSQVFALFINQLTSRSRASSTLTRVNVCLLRLGAQTRTTTAVRTTNKTVSQLANEEYNNTTWTHNKYANNPYNRQLTGVFFASHSSRLLMRQRLTGHQESHIPLCWSQDSDWHVVTNSRQVTLLQPTQLGFTRCAKLSRGRWRKNIHLKTQLPVSASLPEVSARLSKPDVLLARPP